jgi:ATP-binding cassette subfamily B protein
MLLVGLMIAASFAEIFSLSMIFPFLGVLTSPQSVLAHPLIGPLAGALGIAAPSDLILAVAIAFCGAALIAGAVRLLLLYVNTRYSFALGADLSAEVYRRTLYQPYQVHVSRNSSEVINGITGKTAMMIGSVLVPVLTLVSSIVLTVGILAALLAVDPLVAIVAGLCFGAVYWVILSLTRRQLKRDSEIIARESTHVIKALQEGLGGIRDVLIDNTQEAYFRIYQASDRPLRLAQGRTTFTAGSPRFLVETLGLILIAMLAISISQREGGISSAIPVLGALALGAQRLLPIFQQAYTSLATIRGAEASLRDILVLLDQPLPSNLLAGTKPIPFAEEIALENVGFSYSPSNPPVLKNINLRLKRGSRVGFMGATGGGKSTLLDIIMGLLPPTEGRIRVDQTVIDPSTQRGWQAHIAHVPQAIYLSDSTVAENIAFGLRRDEIDMDRVRLAATQAQIASAIESWPLGYDTIVGERGAKLSGGQRQRIGVARALYKRADVIIFDEATSALDNETERALMDSIDRLGDGITVLIVAHRLSTLQNCDFIVELRGGSIFRVGTYAALISSS